MACEHCTDPDGEPCFPSYGLAPHISFNERGEVIKSEMLPESEEANDFTPDPDAPGFGAYHCPKCGHGKPDDKAREVAKRTIESLKRFADDLEAGDLSGYHITRIERVNAFETVSTVINDPMQSERNESAN